MKIWLSPVILISTTILITACASKQNSVEIKEPQKISQGSSGNNYYKAPKFRLDAPNRYIVRSGDTLWRISESFLESPWRWREVWHQNPQIRNPNKIYPGDIISFTTVNGVRKIQVAGSTNPARQEITGSKTSDGRPVYNLNPSIQYEDIDKVIPTIPRESVAPFMNKNIILTDQVSGSSPYVIGDAGGSYLSLSGRSTIYAKADSFDLEQYDVFRPGDVIVDPDSNKHVGIEAAYVGRIALRGEINEDGIAPFEIIDNIQPLYPDDILLAPGTSIEGGNLNFLPAIPDTDVGLSVIKPLGTFNKSTAVQFDTILVNAGANAGIKEGFVYKIVRGGTKTGVGRNGEKYRLPDYDVGIAIIYKTYDDVSYALVMNAYDVIYARDRLIKP